MIGKYLSQEPVIHKTAFIAPGVQLIGAVTIGENSSIWHNSVLRADINTIKIGRGVNIQDGCLLHLEDDQGIIVEDGVTVGHGAILHACTIKKNALIGMGVIILNGAVIEEGAMVGAGALVPPGKIVHRGTLVTGTPARESRKLKAAEIKEIRYWSQKYIKLSREYKQ